MTASGGARAMTLDSRCAMTFSSPADARMKYRMHPVSDMTSLQCFVRLPSARGSSMTMLSASFSSLSPPA